MRSEEELTEFGDPQNVTLTFRSAWSLTLSSPWLVYLHVCKLVASTLVPPLKALYYFRCYGLRLM